MAVAVLLVLLIVALSSAIIAELPSAEAALDVRGHRRLKSMTVLSPPFFLRPGAVANKYYHDIAFPRGHVALKSFNGEVVDDRGAPVPLHEAYLHHWVVHPYYAATNATAAGRPATLPARNSGVCEGDTHGQYYGLGSETRRTATWVPDPYGVEAGDPAAPPEGYEERWMLNVHAIDTRGAADRMGCTECRCDLYNVTVDEHGRRIADDYAGGLLCCYDQTRCRVEEGFVDGEARKLFFRYTVMWLDWSDAVVPVKIYIFDATHRPLPVGCKVEYEVEECSPERRAKNDCVHVQVAKQVVPRGGDLVFGVAHQHAAGIGSSLHGQDGRLLCESIPSYGDGEEAGNEAGYIVGMSTCYHPAPGAVTVRDGETLTVVSNYSSERRHTGVMGLFYILVAEHQRPAPDTKPSLL
ncbi:hypothetical protein SEVIR_6G235200v4 [Setaria viridis]|uniref:Stress up-regulated Nod 19 n=1 Tax=Setaria viridis TaxID=4556 RepID=A0A4U6U8H9_SETVI|nr:uncharacterized protein LOC117860296 [Setaria viridis]TKW11462.1 hypothetical protein SEVIR_6G235200v2 [Setaria viridis]